MPAFELEGKWTPVFKFEDREFIIRNRNYYADTQDEADKMGITAFELRFLMNAPWIRSIQVTAKTEGTFGNLGAVPIMALD